MKKIFVSALLLISSMCIFTACDDDRDSNPTIQEPETFVLNTPAYAASEIDLASSKKINFTCSQPEFGYTAAVTYQLQLSLSNSFTLSVDEAEEEEVPDYAVVDETYTSCIIACDASLFSKAVMQLGQWEEDDVPALQPITVRLVANVDKYSVASNTVDMNVIPYYVELKDALPQLWFFVGNGGVGNWDNSTDILIPMSLVKDFAYDKKTGEGEFTYTGYFDADQFKVVSTPGAWAPMLGLEAEGENGTVKYRPIEKADDPASWKPTAAGYYTFTLNTTGGPANAKAELKAYEGTPKEFTTWEFVGDFDGWGNDPVVLTKNTFNPHIWYGEVTLETDGDAKFRQSDWSDECGGDTFPYGLKTSSNIPVKAGTYKIVFNDIDRCYYFFTKE
ncbi:SusE domain-containing protein [Odoribacter lunatus]|uniref:SusE domain-containing protein n=1 Tax=Odoribacter lunatus TaxID=2941335 RepID=UPI00203E5FA7|nr:SusF/SusE family outer membrane protein [Odoribacter lunatus]